MKKVNIFTILLMLLAGMTILTACGEAVTQYEFRYVQDEIDEYINGKISGLPYTDKAEEGSQYTLLGKIPGVAETNLIYQELHANTHSTSYWSRLGSGWHSFDPGYYKFTATESTTFIVYKRDKYPDNEVLSYFEEVYYVLDLGELDSTQIEIRVRSANFTVADQYITSLAGVQYKVTEWQDDLGNVYTNNSSITKSQYPDRNVLILYSTKKEIASTTYMILDYKGNGSTAGTVPNREAFAAATTVVAKGNDGLLKKPGYVFSGWNTKADGTGTGYAAGADINVSSDLILYAQWERKTLVNFTANYADSGTVPSGEYHSGTTWILPANSGNLVRSGYTFGGWNTRTDGTGVTYAPGSTLLLLYNITLCPKWDLIAVPGNGVEIKVANSITGATIDASHKLYWYVTTDQYCFNAAAVVTNGEVSSVSEIIKVDLPVGKYYVGGFIDMDNSGTKSAGDYEAISYNFGGGLYFGDYFSMIKYTTDQPLELNVSASSGYLEAPLRYTDAALYTVIDPANVALLTAQIKYTGTAVTVDDSHKLSTVILKGGTDMLVDLVGGSFFTVGTNVTKFVVRLEQNEDYYIYSYIDSDGDSDDTATSPYEAGDPAMKYNLKQWSGTPDAFVATASQVYGIIVEYDDSYIE